MRKLFVFGWIFLVVLSVFVVADFFGSETFIVQPLLLNTTYRSFVDLNCSDFSVSEFCFNISGGNLSGNRCLLNSSDFYVCVFDSQCPLNEGCTRDLVCSDLVPSVGFSLGTCPSSFVSVMLLCLYVVLALLLIWLSIDYKIRLLGFFGGFIFIFCSIYLNMCSVVFALVLAGAGIVFLIYWAFSS